MIEPFRPLDAGGAGFLAGVLTIRPFRRTDLEGLIPLVERTFSEVYDPTMYLALAAAWPGGMQVAVDGDGRLVAALVATNSKPAESRLLILAVQGSYRARGLGSRMLRNFIVTCLARGSRALTLEVRVSNGGAVRFYQRHGFAIVGHLPAFYRDGEAGYVMRRAIP